MQTDANSPTRRDQAGSDPTPTGWFPALWFRLAGDDYSTALADIDEILLLTTTRAMVGMPPFVHGVASIRGRLLPIVDLAERFGRPRPRDAAGQPRFPLSSRILRLRAATVAYGVIVDAVLDTMDAPRLPDLPATPTERHCRGMGPLWRHQERLLQAVKLDAILSPEELATLQTLHTHH